MAFAGDALCQGRVQGRAGEHVVVADEGLGVRFDEVYEFFGDELAYVAADDVEEYILRHVALLRVELIQVGNALVAARRGVDVAVVVLIQVFREGGNKFHDLRVDAGVGGPVQPLQVVRFHIQPDEAVFLGGVHGDGFVVVARSG